jgi:monoamine oxidase
VTALARGPGTGRAEVVVVGGGLAGLAAAYALTRLGFDAVVLEAHERVGGRILTIREPFRDGAYAEAGARVVVGDPHLLSLLAALNVEVDFTARGAPPARVWHIQGERRVVPAGTALGTRFGLTEQEEKVLSFQYYVKAARALDDPWAAGWPSPRLAVHDDQSLEGFLAAQGADGPFLELMRFKGRSVGEGIDQVSALCYLREVHEYLRERALPRGRIPGGTDRLPRALAQALGERVSCGAIVRAIEQGAGKARVTFIHRGQPRAVTADRVIVTASLSVLGEITFSPPLSALKRRAIASVPYSSVTRCWVQARRRYWADRGEAGSADTDLPLGQLFDETPAGAPGGLLGTYASGPDARRLAALSELERHRDIARDLELIHPGLSQEALAVASWCWDADPHVRGAYCWFRPGQMRSLLPALGLAEGRVHFAGDHTSALPGWMHGALASARRVVGEVTAQTPSNSNEGVRVAE